MIKNLEISEITLGSLKFMKNKQCQILSGNADLDSFIEFLFIHTRPIKTLRKMSDEEYNEALEEFADGINFNELPEISKAVNERLERMMETEFTQADSGKKKD